MYLIFPDGRVETREFKSFRDISDGTNAETGYDNAFTVVPLHGGYRVGYAVYANDCGLLIGLPRNPKAMELTGSPHLVGPVIVASFEEAKEDDLLASVDHEYKKAFESRLARLQSANN